MPVLGHGSGREDGLPLEAAADAEDCLEGAGGGGVEEAGVELVDDEDAEQVEAEAAAVDELCDAARVADDNTGGCFSELELLAAQVGLVEHRQDGEGGVEGVGGRVWPGGGEALEGLVDLHAELLGRDED